MIKQYKDGYRQLAAAIIHEAVKEWKYYPSVLLKQFFLSDWFELLADYLDISPDVVREKIGVSTW